MNNSEISEIIFQWRIDRSSMKRAQSEVRQGFSNLTSDAASANQGFRQLADGTYELVDATDSWANNMDALRRSLDPVEESVESLRREWQETSDVIERPIEPNIRPASGSTRGGASLTDRVDRFGRFSTQIAGGLGASELGNTTGLVGDLTDALGTLGPVGVAATGAIVGLSIGIQVLNTRTAEAEKTFNAAVDAQTSYYDAVRNLTSQQVRELIPELERDIEVDRLQLAEGRAALEGNFSDAGYALVNVASALGVSAAQNVNEFREQLDQLEQSITANEQTVGRLSVGLQTNAFAYNDAIEAEEAYLEAKVKNALASQETQEELAAVTEASRRYADQLAYTEKQTQLAIEAEAQRYAQLLEYEEKQARLAAEQQAVDEAVAARDEALKKRQSLLEDALQDSTKAAENAAKAQQDYNDAQRKGEQQISDLIRSYQMERLERQEDYEAHVLEIQEDAAFDRLSAVGDRDAESAYKARQEADKSLRDERRNYEREELQQHRANEERLRIERRQLTDELAIKQRGLSAANSLLITAITTQNTILSQAYGVQFSIVDNFVTKTIASVSRLNSGFVKTPTGGGSGKSLSVINQIVDARLNNTLKAAGGR